MSVRAIVCTLIAAFGFCGASAANAEDPWLTYAGGEGPGSGKHIVMVAGDEEYRSEEALPMLAGVLSKQGFDCTVLLPVDPKTGEIDPNAKGNIPGLKAIAKADLLIVFTRFRDLPDDEMKYFDDYLMSGRPVIGLRTATHAFATGSSAWAHYSNSYSGDKKEWTDGFGRLVLGEKWISHHGNHGSESTRGILVPEAKDHPILRGLKDGDVWGDSDVYGVRLPLPDDSQPLVLGQVLTGMSPDDEPVKGPKNEPMMPVAWTKSYELPGGKPGRAFTTTMGAATDLAHEGTRRMVVNAVYYLLDLQDKLPAEGASVDIEGEYKPSKFGFGGHIKGRTPADLMKK